jgi:hypothetical protein
LGCVRQIILKILRHLIFKMTRSLQAAQLISTRGGLLEYGQHVTTELCDRRNDRVTLDQVERIVL